MKCCSIVIFLFLLIVVNLVLEVHTDSASVSEKYYVRSEFNDKGCPLDDIAFTKTAPSKTVCTTICSNYSSCKCVSYNTADQMCIGCTGIYEVSNELLDKPGHKIYESELHKDECLNSECLNGATCVDGVNTYTCTCAAGWTGEFCDTDIDECVNSGCLHGGTCVDGVNTYTCTCTAGWTGKVCGTDLDECENSGCQNGATCEDGANSYTCVCAAGWTGELCDTDLDECVNSKCLNGATCVDGDNTYTCICAAGWTGEFCDTDLDECANSGCLNGATCVDGLNTYSCICAAGWTGPFCDKDLDDCVNSGCLNGATCVDGVNTYTCICAAGWTGGFCGIDLDECVNSGCLNGGTCVDGENTYSCICAAGWTGEFCGTDLDECVNSGCLNGATCVDGENTYSCICAAGWTGELCDTGTTQIPTATGSQAGTEFVTGFMSFGLSNDGIPKLIIVSSSAFTTNVNVTIPFLNKADQHVVNGVLFLDFSNGLLLGMNIVTTQKAVRITSDNPITLFTEASETGQIGCTLVLPTSALGLQYIVNAHDVTRHGLPQILITSIADNTQVSLTLPSLLLVDVTLNKDDVYQYRSSKPLAGTLISANKPVAVNVGHSCANIPTGLNIYCEFMVTTVTPIESIGSVYIVPYQKQRSKYSIGVSAPYDNTDVTFWTKNQIEIITHTLNSQYSVFNTPESSMVISIITSTNDILVSQYGHSSGGSNGGPSQMIVPAVNQYGSSYEFAVSNYINSQGYISVVIDKTYGTAGLLLNGSPPTVLESHDITVPNGHGTYKVIYLSVNKGVKYTLNHANPSARFAAILYARNSNNEYTTSLGFQL